MIRFNKCDELRLCKLGICECVERKRECTVDARER